VTTIAKSVKVRVPVTTAYNQWTQFETFPTFMAGVERVTQVTDTLTHWETAIGGARREFDAEIVEQRPDERVVWHTVRGAPHNGVVFFRRLDDNTTRIDVRMEYEARSVTEKAGSMLGLIANRIRGDLDRFKEFIEMRGRETGGWRGNVPRPPE